MKKKKNKKQIIDNLQKYILYDNQNSKYEGPPLIEPKIPKGYKVEVLI